MDLPELEHSLHSTYDRYSNSQNQILYILMYIFTLTTGILSDGLTRAALFTAIQLIAKGTVA